MKQRKKQCGGVVGCASNAATVLDPTCLPDPDVKMYVQPCSNLTENQFGMQGMAGLSLRGGRKKRQQRVSNRRQLRGGSCGGPNADCFGNNYDNLGATAISDGGSNDPPNASELAWFFRNSYGATPSTNVIPQPNINTSCSQTQKGGRRRCHRVSKRRAQRGGNYFFNLNQRIGGLPQVDNTYDPYAPSLSNLQVNGHNPSDVRVVNVIPYDTQYNGATAVPLIETSSLTRNSFELSGGSKKRSFLTRRSRNHLFGGSVGAYPSALNGFPGDFSADMETRQFNCNQPNWCPKCT